MVSGRVFDAALDLLDRQLVDANGRLAGKVDDIELTVPSGWPDESREPPVVTALLAGPAALAMRFGGRFAHGWANLHRRLHPSQPGGPAQVPFTLVKRISSRIELIVPREDLELNRFEEWFRVHVVEKLPGASHAAE